MMLRNVRPWGYRLVVLAMLVAVSDWSRAAQGDSADRACEPQPFRFEDDCRGLASQSVDLHGLDRLKYLPLTEDGSIWLTVGGEYRARVESLDQPNFGVSPVDKAFVAWGQRFLAEADLRTTAGWRVFVQLSASTDTGRKPAERPFDRSDPDLAQGFVEIPLPIPGAPATLRIGRQELDLGGTRLVSPSEVANLRRAFDMVHVDTRIKDLDIVGFWGRPVVNQRSAFDDTAPPSESFYGLVLHAQPRLADHPVTVDMLLLGRERDKAVYVDAVGPEHRRLVGLRAAGDFGPIDYSAAVSYEFGRIARSDISAYGVSLTGGYRFSGLRWTPRLGVDFGLSSGDRQRKDGTLNTFDPLYPNLGYFTDAPVDFPANWIGLEPNLTIEPWSRLSIKMGADIHFRDTTTDAIYGSNALPFVPGGAPGGNFADVLGFVHATWRATPRLQIEAGYVHGWVGRPITAVGGRDLNYELLKGSYRF